MARPRAAPRQPSSATTAAKQENIPPATRQQRTSTRIPTAAAETKASKTTSSRREIEATARGANPEPKETAEPPRKRGRPKGSTAGAKRKAELIAQDRDNGSGREEDATETTRTGKGSRGDESGDELGNSPPLTKKMKKKTQQQQQQQQQHSPVASSTTRGRAGRKGAANAHKTASPAKKDSDQSDEGLSDIEVPNPNHQGEDEPERILEQVTELQETYPSSQKPQSSLASLTAGVKDSKVKQKISDLYEGYKALEEQYNKLRDVGITESKSLIEQMSEQCRATLTASKKLVENMQKELDAARSAARKMQTLEKQLNESNNKVAELTKSKDAMAADLADAESEKKKLKAKLEAARSAPAAVENMKIPTNGMKNNRGLAAAGAEAAKTAKLVQLKEDLYSDLSGLIILDVKVDSSDNVYDCIQTGLHATLHFKLWIPHGDDGKMASRDTATIRYTPLLENAVDRQALRILPDYLTTEITFARTEAPKFYRRVIRTLDQKIEDDEDEDDDEEDDDEEEEEEEEEEGDEDED